MDCPWDVLRLWMREHEITQLRTGQGPALTPAQCDAIAALVSASTQRSGFQGSATAPALAPAPASRSRPVVDPEYDRERNWVAELFEHIQKNGYQPATFDALDLELAPKAGVHRKFVPVFAVPHLNTSFPNENYGFLDGEAPCFSVKKDAKKYAAMCAMRCISGLIAPPTTDPSPPTSIPQTPNPAGLDSDADNGVRLVRNGGPSSEMPHSARKKARLDDDEPGVLQLVPRLCKTLDMMAPQFQVTPAKHGRGTNLFDARAVFQDAVTEGVPDGLGAVEGFITKTSAREASAQVVLDFLRERERERAGEFRELCR